MHNYHYHSDNYQLVYLPCELEAVCLGSGFLEAGIWAVIHFPTIGMDGQQNSKATSCPSPGLQIHSNLSATSMTFADGIRVIIICLEGGRLSGMSP